MAVVPQVLHTYTPQSGGCCRVLFRNGQDILFCPRWSRDIKEHVSHCEVNLSQTDQKAMWFHSLPERPWCIV